MTALPVMKLTKIEPVERLKELSKLFGGSYGFKTELFDNGILISVILTCSEGITLDQAATFVEGACVEHARCVVSAILLDRLNLGVDDAEPEDSEEEDEENSALAEMADMGLSLVTGLMRDAMTTLKGHVEEDDVE